MFDQRYTPIGLKYINLFKPLKFNGNFTLQHRAEKDHVLRNKTEYATSKEWKKYISKPYNKTGDKIREMVEEYYYKRFQRPGTLNISKAMFIS